MSNETIVDIVAEMRKDMPRVVDTKVILRNYADRIEAAISNQPNKVETVLNNLIRLNTAKMREVLKELSDISFATLIFPLDGDSSAIYGSDKKMVTLPMWMIAEILNAVKCAQDKANAALSAPARNCDLYATCEDAYEGYKVYEKVPLIPFQFAPWLFAEAKGEAK